jgi:amino acid permease
VKASDYANKNSVQSLALYCFGKKGRFVINFLVFMQGWGFVACYTIIIAVIWVGQGILLPISLPRSMASLAKFSIVGLGAIAIIIACVLSVGPTLPAEDKGVEDIVLIRVGGIGTAICVLSFAYLCQHSVLLNYHQMKNKSVKVFSKVSSIAVGLTCLMTVAVSMAYLGFREQSSIYCVSLILRYEYSEHFSVFTSCYFSSKIVVCC